MESKTLSWRQNKLWMNLNIASMATSNFLIGSKMKNDDFRRKYEQILYQQYRITKSWWKAPEFNLCSQKENWSKATSISIVYGIWERENPVASLWYKIMYSLPTTAKERSKNGMMELPLSLNGGGEFFWERKCDRLSSKSNTDTVNGRLWPSSRADQSSQW